MGQRASRSKLWRKRIAHSAQEFTTSARPTLRWLAPLYGQIAGFLQEFRKQQTGRAGFPALKDSDIFFLLIFLLRVGKQQANGRPLSRAFLSFLRERFPQAAAEKESSRIIVP